MKSHTVDCCTERKVWWFHQWEEPEISQTKQQQGLNSQPTPRASKSYKTLDYLTTLDYKTPIYSGSWFIKKRKNTENNLNSLCSSQVYTPNIANIYLYLRFRNDIHWWSFPSFAKINTDNLTKHRSFGISDVAVAKRHQDAGWIPTRWAQFFTVMAGENSGARTRGPQGHILAWPWWIQTFHEHWCHVAYESLVKYLWIKSNQVRFSVMFHLIHGCLIHPHIYEHQRTSHQWGCPKSWGLILKTSRAFRRFWIWTIGEASWSWIIMNNHE